MSSYSLSEPVMEVTPSKSVLLCDVPFLEGIEADMPFRNHNADVPDDLLACTPIHGWDSPPDSPAHISVDMLEGVDPMLTNKLNSFFEDPVSSSLAHSFSSQLYDWTPPASPVPTSDCDDLMEDFHDFPDLNAFDEAPPLVPLKLENKSQALLPGQMVMPTMHQVATVGSKRKASSSLANDDREKKRIKDKQDAARAARTEACEQAVKALAQSKNDEDPESKRHTHNVLERKRRNDLKNSYQLLRERVPSLEDDDRAPTGKILLHAVEFIQHLQKTESMLITTMAQVQGENERLRLKAGLL